MKAIKIILAAGVVTFGIAAGHAVPVQAGEQPNVLIMGDDADQDSIPRNSRVFNRVLAALSSEMNAQGFNIYDETALTLDDYAQGRTRRTDAELIDIARTIKKTPIDVATIFTIYANAKKMSYTTKIKTRITGRLLNVRNGQRLGNFEVELPMADNAPVDCNRDCILEAVGGNAKMLAQDLGVVLAKKLDALSPVASNAGGTTTNGSASGMETAYSLKFSGFSPDEITAIEEYMVAFSGYKHHRPVKSSLRTNEYWYETGSDEARLNRNLRRMLDHLGVEGRVVHSGDTFSVEKIGLNRKKRN